MELVGLKDLPSLLSISWLIIVLPTTCKSNRTNLHGRALTAVPVSEVIALELRRNSKNLPYLYTQIFAGVAYLVAGALMSTLAVMKRRQEKVAAWTSRPPGEHA